MQDSNFNVQNPEFNVHNCFASCVAVFSPCILCFAPPSLLCTMPSSLALQLQQMGACGRPGVVSKKDQAGESGAEAAKLFRRACQGSTVPEVNEPVESKICREDIQWTHLLPHRFASPRTRLPDTHCSVRAPHGHACTMPGRHQNAFKLRASIAP